MSKATIDLNLVKAAAFCVSKEETRYYLNGVYITYDMGALISVATDGHRLAAFRHTLEQDVPLESFGVIVPLAIINGIKLNKAGSLGTLAHVEGLKWSIEYNGQTVTFDAIDGTFPDWRRIEPKETSGEIAQFNMSYMADFAKMSKQLGKTTPNANIAHNGQGPALVTFGGEVDGSALLMPFRDRGEAQPLPAWITAPLAAHETQESVAA